MKKALYIILFISLFSYLFGAMIRCARDYKFVCKDYDILDCDCVKKTSSGKYVIEKSCDSPKTITCTGMGAYINCVCSYSDLYYKEKNLSKKI
jgi:hypothetical protein